MYNMYNSASNIHYFKFRWAIIYVENNPKVCATQERSTKNNNDFVNFSIVVCFMILLLAKYILTDFIAPPLV